MYNLLILDDCEGWKGSASEDHVGKGYAEIDTWFPGVFDITGCNNLDSERENVRGMELVREKRWDVVLLDFNFDPPDLYDGVRALRAIKDGINKEAWVIGCSHNWPYACKQEALAIASILASGEEISEMRIGQMMEKILAAIAMNPQELRDALAKFLSSR